MIMEKLDMGNKKIFEYNNETRKTAYLNWQMYPRQPIHNMNVLAEGYKSAANYLIKECLDDNACIFRKNCASVPEERSAIPLQTEQSSAG